MVLGPLSAPKPQHALDITERIARQLNLLREERGLTPDELADRSGVSRAMIYRIEAGQASPTVVVLNKLATGLGVLLPTLLGPGDYREPRLNLRHPVVSPESAGHVAGSRYRLQPPHPSRPPPPTRRCSCRRSTSRPARA